MAATQKKIRRRRMRYRVNRIKQAQSYDAADIAKLFGVHRNTVRHWLKTGLATIDDRRPALVHGTVLKAFITQRSQAARQKCAPGEFFCFRCRKPRKAWGATADVSFRSDKVANLTALCSSCETAMNRTVRRADLSHLATLMNLHTLGQQRLNDGGETSANSDSERATLNAET